MRIDYREPYPSWIVVGMDVLAAGILVASFRDAWAIVSSLGQGAIEHANSWSHLIVAGAVVLAIDASILILEQARSQMKLRGAKIIVNDLWVAVLILLSAALNVRYLTAHGEMIDRVLGGVLGVAIPTTIAVLGYLKGEMLAYNTRLRLDKRDADLAAPANAALPSPAAPPVAYRPPADAATALTMATTRPHSLIGGDDADDEEEAATPGVGAGLTTSAGTTAGDGPRFRLRAAG